jgi:hypothetical protein
MLTKMKMRLVSVLMGTAMAVAPMSLGTCEMMYTPPVDGSGVTTPVDVPSTDGTGTGSTDDGSINSDPSGNGDGGYGTWSYAGAWTYGGQSGSYGYSGFGRP